MPSSYYRTFEELGLGKAVSRFQGNRFLYRRQPRAGAVYKMDEGATEMG